MAGISLQNSFVQNRFVFEVLPEMFLNIHIYMHKVLIATLMSLQCLYNTVTVLAEHFPHYCIPTRQCDLLRHSDFI